MHELTDEQIREGFAAKFPALARRAEEATAPPVAIRVRDAFFDGARFAERALKVDGMADRAWDRFEAKSAELAAKVRRHALPPGWSIEESGGEFIVRKHRLDGRLLLGAVASRNGDSITECVLAELAADLLAMAQPADARAMHTLVDVVALINAARDVVDNLVAPLDAAAQDQLGALADALLPFDRTADAGASTKES